MTVGLIVVCLLAAGALALPHQRGRAQAALAALAITPVLLVVQLRNTSEVHRVLDRPPLFAAAVVAGLVVVAALAVLLDRRPGLLPLIVVAALPFRIPIAAGGGTANLLVPLYLVVGAGILAWAVGVLRRPEVPRWNGEGEPPPRTSTLAGRRTEPGALEYLLGATLVLYALQSAYTDDLDRAAQNVLFFYVPFALLFVLLVQAVAWSKDVALRCLGVLVGLALILAGVGFVEYATRHLFLNPKVIESNQLEDYFRVNSLFFDPNIYGRFLALVALAVTTVLLWDPRPKVTYGAAGILAVLWAALVTSLSQSSFTALLVGLAILAALRWRPRLAIGAVSGLAVVGVLIVLVAPGAIGLKLHSRSSREDATSGRYSLVSGGITLAKKKPLQGYGSGGFSRAYRRHVNGSAEKATSASHTIPITVLAEQGVIGLTVYLALVLVALRRLGRRARDEPFRAFVIAAFGALLVHTMLYADFLEDPLTWTLLGVGTALAAASPSRHRTRLARPRRAVADAGDEAPMTATERAEARRAAAAGGGDLAPGVVAGGPKTARERAALRAARREAEERRADRGGEDVSLGDVVPPGDDIRASRRTTGSDPAGLPNP